MVLRGKPAWESRTLPGTFRKPRISGLFCYGDYDEIRNVLGKTIIGDDNRPTSLVSQRDKARNLKDELLREESLVILNSVKNVLI